jgi:hypothetical protein
MKKQLKRERRMKENMENSSKLPLLPLIHPIQTLTGHPTPKLIRKSQPKIQSQSSPQNQTKNQKIKIILLPIKTNQPNPLTKITHFLHQINQIILSLPLLLSKTVITPTKPKPK